MTFGLDVSCPKSERKKEIYTAPKGQVDSRGNPALGGWGLRPRGPRHALFLPLTDPCPLGY